MNLPPPDNFHCFVTLGRRVALREVQIQPKQNKQQTSHNVMKQTILAFAILGVVSLTSAQEKLSTDEALPYAQAVSKHLQGTPIATDVDPDKPVVVRDGEFGGMVLPQKNLKLETITKAGETAVPIGQLWLKQLTPMHNGEAVTREKLRLVTVSGDGEEVTAPQCVLAVRKNTSGSLELLVYGKGKEPITTAALKPLDATQSLPIDLAAVREDEVGKLTVKILGKYQATLSVTELVM